MMDLRRLDKRLIFGGLFLVAALLAWLIFGDDDAPDDKAQVELGIEAPPLDAWSAEEARNVEVRIDDAGPVLALDGERQIALTPASSELTVDDWSIHRRDGQTYVVGSGDFDGAPAEAVWTFTEGNPQLHFQMSLDGLPAARLTEDVVFDLSLPASELELAAPVSRMPEGVAEPALWRDDNVQLTFQNWTGEKLAPLPGPQDTPTLGLVLWSQETGAHWTPCEGDEETTIDTSVAFTVTLAFDEADEARPPVARWPRKSGSEGLMVPIFSDPTEHDDAELKEGATDDPERWVGRARALSYGHSNPGEPRYGNGGLLGHGLGGSIVVPADFADADVVRDFAESLADSKVELIAASSAEPWQSYTRLLDEPTCEDLVEAATGSAPAMLLDAQKEAGIGSGSPQVVGPANLAPLVSPRGLDGRRQTLIDDGFGRAQELVDDREPHIFESPFVATRNPLVGAANEALLKPERQGHWTIASALSGAFADLELLDEEVPLEVTSLADAARHTSAARKVMWWWDESGDLLVYNPQDEGLSNFTLAFAGRGEAKSAESALRSRPVVTEAGDASLVWWNLRPGINRIELSGFADEAAGYAPINWHIDGP